MIQDVLETIYTSTKIRYILAPLFVVQILPPRCQFSYTSFVLETSIFLPPPSTLLQNTPTSLSPYYQYFRQNVGPRF